MPCITCGFHVHCHYLASVMAAKRFFKDSLQFACTKCGKCCKGRTNVFVNASEVEAMAKHLSVDKFDFVKTYTEDRDTPSGLLTSLKTVTDKNGAQSCVFLKNNQCSVYEARPTQCRTYPFWPLHLIGEAEWRAEARNCEGITLKTPSSSKTPAKVENVVSPDEILTNLVVHMVHDRGTGPDWTYDESRANLKESQEIDPATMQEFEDDYFSTHYSNIVFENRSIMVVDCTTPDANAAAAEEEEEEGEEGGGAFRGLEELDEADDALAGADEFLEELEHPTASAEEASATAVAPKKATSVNTFRRLEFISMPSVTQSEVLLLAQTDPSTGVVTHVIDHSTVSLPVHKVISEVFLQHMLPLLSFSNRPVRLLMIGAGGCVLPSHLLHHIRQQSRLLVPGVIIDAVEPEADIVQAAQDWFGASFNEQLVPHVTDGLTFLRSHNEHNALPRSAEFGAFDETHNYDVIVLDAFESAAAARTVTQSGASASALRSRAPPVSLIDGFKEVTAALLNLSSGSSRAQAANGLLIINVFGDKHWLLKTMSQYNISSGYCKPIVIVIGNSDVVSENNYVLITTPVGKLAATAAATTSTGSAKSNFTPSDDSKAATSSPSVPSAGVRLNSQSLSCTRLDEISHSMTASPLFSHQVVNDGIIFLYNGEPSVV